MIIIDYNGVAVSSIMAQRVLEENMIRHMILNTIRMYRQKFTKEYGEVVIAADGKFNWRKDYYPQYKAARKKGRDESDFDWKEAFRILNEVREEIKENMPYKVLHIDKCEADDVIGTLVENTAEFGNWEPVMIISSDKDFAQLQRFDHVAQFSPFTKKLIKEPNPRKHLQDHIIKGDSGDGVPNILSDDNVFVEGLRQTPVTKKKMETIVEALTGDGPVEEQTWYRNYLRNKKLIDLTETPQELKDNILKEFNAQDPSGNKSKVLNYLINKQCKLLIECVTEFIQ